MTHYVTRPIERADFSALMGLEETLFGGTDDGVLGPYYIRLCCEFFRDTCSVVEVDGRPVGYLLAFMRGDEVYCTTLAVLPEYQGTRALLHLLRAFVGQVHGRVRTCWFTVEEDNRAARALHRMLGAEEVEVRKDFYGPGRDRIVSRIDEQSLQSVYERMARLGILPGRARARLHVVPSQAATS